MNELNLYKQIASDVTYEELSDLAKELEMDETELAECLILMTEMLPVDFDSQTDGDDDGSKNDNYIVDDKSHGKVQRVTEDEAFISISQQAFLNLCDAVLTEREKTILQLKYLEDFTLEEIGVQLRITAERVRQIHYEIIAKILVIDAMEEAIKAQVLTAQETFVLQLRFIEGKGRNITIAIMELENGKELKLLETSGLNKLRTFASYAAA